MGGRTGAEAEQQQAVVVPDVGGGVQQEEQQQPRLQRWHDPQLPPVGLHPVWWQRQRGSAWGPSGRADGQTW